MKKQVEEFKKKLPYTIEWKGDHVEMIDQQLLPGELKIMKLETVHEVAGAIYMMNIRGAQAIEGAAACGMGLGGIGYRGTGIEEYKKHLQTQSELLKETRPTAVNLSWAVDLCLERAVGDTVDAIRDNILEAVGDIFEKEVEHNIQLGVHGSELIPENAHVLTHCNAGSLSSIWFGTNSAPIFTAHLAGKSLHIHVDETRPVLQGARLSAWEFDRVGIDYSINVDNAAGYLMANKKVDLVIVGADRIASNGDVANKIGTYQLAVLAKRHKIPFYVAAVGSTIDQKIKSGDEIPIEERAASEVLTDIKYRDQLVAPKDARAENPAFDVTPAELITKIITENGVFNPNEI